MWTNFEFFQNFMKFSYVFRLSPSCINVEKWKKFWVVNVRYRIILEQCGLLKLHSFCGLNKNLKFNFQMHVVVNWSLFFSCLMITWKWRLYRLVTYPMQVLAVQVLFTFSSLNSFFPCGYLTSPISNYYQFGCGISKMVGHKSKFFGQESTCS